MSAPRELGNPSASAPAAEPALKLLVDNVVDYAIFLLDTTGHVMSWNAGAERIKGYRAEEIIGQHFSVFYPPEDLAVDKPGRELEVAVADGRLEDEGWRVRQDGSRFWANVVITALFDETGTLRGFGKVTRDMTDRRAAEQALRESEERFRLLVQDVVDYAIFMLDPTGHVMSWNAGAERIKGYRAEEIIGQHFSVFYPPEDLAVDKPGRELEVAVADGRLEDEGWRVRQDGSRFWANVVITALFDETGTLRGFGKVTRDMTDRRTTERALVEGRRLLAHLVEAQEAERRRIAWDVHDDSIQAMVAVGMRLQLLASRVPEEYAGPLHQLDQATANTISRLRNLIFRLRPPGIDREALREALASYLDQVVEGWGLAQSLHYDLPVEPPTETAITIFRICQEALTNVHKHAKATSVQVRVAGVNSGVLVQVVDDGAGMDSLPARLSQGDHFGIVEMRERAETAGGWWTIRSQPGHGSTVEFWLPAPQSDTDPRP